MYRIAACKNLLPCKKIPESFLKSPDISHVVSRSYSSATKKKGGHPILYTLGFTSLTVGGVVAYAKFDKDFRLWLEENLPGSDKFIEVVTEEKGVGVADIVVNKYEDIKQEVDVIKTETLSKIEDLTGFKFDSAPPTVSTVSSKLPTNIPVATKKVEEKLAEKSSTELKEVTHVAKSVLPKESESPSPTLSTSKLPPSPPSTHSTPKPSAPAVDLKSFADLERGLKLWASAALAAYENGLEVLSKFDNTVVSVIDSSVERPGSSWSSLATLRGDTEKSISKIEVNAADALKSIHNLKSQVSDPKFAASPEQVQSLGHRINDVISQVEQAKARFEAQKSRNNVTENYVRRIEEEKRKHQEELSILFPDLESYEKDPALKNLNLLLLYASNKIQFYQKELAKLEMQHQKSLKGDSTGHIELGHERRNLTEEFQKKALELQALFEKDIRTQLKRQAEAHSDHLQEVLNIKQAVTDSKTKREYETKLLEEKAKYKEQIGAMIGRMKAFEEAFKKRAYAEEAVQHSQALWSSCQALILSIKNSVTPHDVKPLKKKIDAIKKSAAKSDTFVDTVCAAFPAQALSQGVYSEYALRERFLNVQDSAYRVALVPDEGSSLPIVFLSYLQSLFIIRGLAAISPEEIRDEPSSKVNSLNTYEILERARYFVDRSDLLQAVKYMNLLSGGAKAVSQEWISDTLVYLETETAAKALLSHAASVSFVQ